MQHFDRIDWYYTNCLDIFAPPEMALSISLHLKVARTAAQHINMWSINMQPQWAYSFNMSTFTHESTREHTQ